MARISISETARQLGISRQHLYRHIDSGKISVSTDERGDRYIDDSEIRRVVESKILVSKQLSPVRDTVQELRQQVTPQNDAIIEGLHREIELLHEQLRKADERIRVEQATAQDRERWLQGQVEKLTDAVKQLEHKPITPVTSSWWSRLVGRG